MPDLTNLLFAYQTADGSFLLKSGARTGAVVDQESIGLVDLPNRDSGGVFIPASSDLPVSNLVAFAILQEFLQGDCVSLKYYVDKANNTSNDDFAKSTLSGVVFAHLATNTTQPLQPAMFILQNKGNNLTSSVSYFDGSTKQRYDFLSSDYTNIHNDSDLAIVADADAKFTEIDLASITGDLKQVTFNNGGNITDLGDKTYLACPAILSNLRATTAAPNNLILEFDAISVVGSKTGNDAVANTSGAISLVDTITDNAAGDYNVSNADMQAGKVILTNSDLSPGSPLIEGSNLNIYFKALNSVCVGEPASLSGVLITNSFTNLSFSSGPTLAQDSVTKSWDKINFTLATNQSDLPNPSAIVELKDPAGNVVQSLNLPAKVNNVGAITWDAASFTNVPVGTYIVQATSYSGSTAGASVSSSQISTQGTLPSVAASIQLKSGSFTFFEYLVTQGSSDFAIQIRYNLTNADPTTNAGTSLARQGMDGSGSSKVVGGNSAALNANALVRSAIQVSLADDATIVGPWVEIPNQVMFVLNQLTAPSALVKASVIQPDLSVSNLISWTAGSGEPSGTSLIYTITETFTGSVLATTKSLSALLDGYANGNYSITANAISDQDDDSENTDPAKESTAATIAAQIDSGLDPIQSHYQASISDFSYPADRTSTDFSNNKIKFTLATDGLNYDIDTTENVDYSYEAADGSRIANGNSAVLQASGKTIDTSIPTATLGTFTLGQRFRLRVVTKLVDKIGGQKAEVISYSQYGAIVGEAPTLGAGTINTARTNGSIDVTTNGLSSILKIYAILENGSCQEISMNAVNGTNFFTTAVKMQGFVAVIKNAISAASSYTP